MWDVFGTAKSLSDLAALRLSGNTGLTGPLATFVSEIYSETCELTKASPSWVDRGLQGTLLAHARQCKPQQHMHAWAGQEHMLWLS